MMATLPVWLDSGCDAGVSVKASARGPLAARSARISAICWPFAASMNSGCMAKARSTRLISCAILLVLCRRLIGLHGCRERGLHELALGEIEAEIVRALLVGGDPGIGLFRIVAHRLDDV